MNHEELQGIAIIGMAGRFPGAENVSTFWHNVQNKVESVKHFSEEELRAAGVDEELLQNPRYVRAGGVLEDVAGFDAPFFDMTAREAELTDPQHRLFLECAWEALEHAGYEAQSYSGRVGVFGGVGSNRYGERVLQNEALRETVGDLQAFLGSGHDFLATRVSYKLNLNGPSLTVQTACSTSLVAVHLACQNLLLQECDMALAGGVSIRHLQQEGYLYQEGSILSPDGHCRAFDEQAKGTVGGDGAGMVVLKRVEDAIADGDTIYAVIRGSAMNNDGHEKIGFTAPSVDGQAAVIREALAVAEVDASSIGYIEAHGTGTPLGDPIELSALQEAFAESGTAYGSCAIGSVKTNIGHLDAAAGVTSLIKAALALHDQVLPPSLHLETPTPVVDWTRSPFQVNTELRCWEEGSTPRRAGVSSFGIGGTNAHVVLEEAPRRPTASASRPAQLLVWSAETAEALDAATERLQHHLEIHPDVLMADVAYTLQLGRKAMRHRRMLVTTGREDTLQALSAHERSRLLTAQTERRDRPVVFVFPGQGTQHPNMALDLYREEPVFRDTVDQCAELLQPELGFDIRIVLYPTDAEKSAAEAQLSQTKLTQPALFVIEYALAKLWMAWGVTPSAMIGHSIGEYVAACLAGVLSLADALRLIAIRGRLMQAMPEGAMLAVPLREAELLTQLPAGVELAAVNGPSACIAAGPVEGIELLSQRLASQGVLTRRLRTSHAFHTYMMEPMLDEFAQTVASCQLQAPHIPYLSNVTGTWIQAQQATDPSYWSRHLRQTVKFDDGVRELLSDSGHIWLEVGPGHSYASLVKQQAAAMERHEETVLSSLPTRDDSTNSSQAIALLDVLGRIWLSGARINWQRLYDDETRHRLPLPTYPFERKRYWLEEAPTPASAPTKTEKQELSDWFYLPTWKRTRPPELLPPAVVGNQWLVFLDEQRNGDPLVQQLRASGVDVMTVSIGERFEQQGTNHFLLPPADRGEYRELFRTLRESGRLPQNIVHLWSLRAQLERTLPGDRLACYQHAQERGFYSLLYLAQAIGEQAADEAISLCIVTDHLQDATGEAIQGAERATLFGPCKVIPQEYTNISCRCIDIAVDQDEGNVWDRVLVECGRLSDDLFVAYRKGIRYVQDFEPLSLPATPQTILQSRGVYLITGAEGESGLTLAESLAHHCQARLVLVASEAIDSVEGRRTRLERLSEVGTQWLWLEADVQNLSDLHQALHQAHEHFGEIVGVFHAAEVASNGLMQLKTEEAADRVLEPLVKGALVLEQALRDFELKFLALYASTAAFIGGFGRVERSAAHAFYNAFAQEKSAEGLPVYAINWGLWQWDDSLEREVAGVPKLFNHYRKWRREYGIAPEEGIDALERIIASRSPQLIVSTQDFAEALAEQGSLTAASFWNAMEEARQELLQTQDEASNDEAAPMSELEQTIADIWRELFGVNRIGAEQNFFELGGNSLVAIQLITRLRQTFETEVPIHAIFESPTVAGLAREVSALLMTPEELDELERLLQEIEALSAQEIAAQLADE